MFSCQSFTTIQVIQSLIQLVRVCTKNGQEHFLRFRGLDNAFTLAPYGPHHGEGWCIGCRHQTNLYQVGA